MKRLVREIETKSLRIKYKKDEWFVPKDELKKLLKVDGFIRVLDREYEELDKFYEKDSFFGHFSLQHTTSEPGKKYALLRVIEQGSYEPSLHRQHSPLLGCDKIWIAQCTETKNNLEYDSIPKSCFESSLKNVKTPDELKVAILLRYNKSLPEIDRKHLLQAGVGWTSLQLKQRRNLKMDEKKDEKQEK